MEKSILFFTKLKKEIILNTVKIFFYFFILLLILYKLIQINSLDVNLIILGTTELENVTIEDNSYNNSNEIIIVTVTIILIILFFSLEPNIINEGFIEIPPADIPHHLKIGNFAGVGAEDIFKCYNADVD